VTAAEYDLLEAKRERDHCIRGWPEWNMGAEPNLGEICYLIRCRMDERMKDMAKDIGTSHVTMIRWERGRGRCSRLWDYWAEQGWRLPVAALEKAKALNDDQSTH